ncbi:MAG: hypothetical protein R3E46_10215 [Sedimenticolaceae bacterium]|jgi:hypothetical protein
MRYLTCGRAFGPNLGHRRLALRGVSLMLVLWAVAGCSSLPPNIASAGRLQIDRVDSNNAIIGQVHVGAVADGVRVSGSLRKTFLRRGRIPGHLHIEMRAADGKVLETRVTRYHRRFAKSGRAYFAQTLAVRPDAVRTVRLVHHRPGDRHS